MTENTNEPLSDGYTAEGRALEEESLPPEQPTDAAPAPNPADAGYGVEGRELERESLISQEPASVPEQPVMPYSMPKAQPQPEPARAQNAQQAYHAAYGAPTGGQPHAAQQPYAAGPAPRPVAPAKPKTPVDARRVFLACGLAVGCVMIVFGLCMLAFYTPNAYEQAAEAVAQMGLWDSQSYTAPSYIGASEAQVIKTGFSLLLISLGAADICAFGAKLFEKKN